MNSIEALDFALGVLRARQRRLENAVIPNGHVRERNAAGVARNLAAIETLVALKDTLADRGEPSFVKHLPPEVQAEIREWQP